LAHTAVVISKYTGSTIYPHVTVFTCISLLVLTATANCQRLAR